MMAVAEWRVELDFWNRQSGRGHGGIARGEGVVVGSVKGEGRSGTPKVSHVPQLLAAVPVVLPGGCLANDGPPTTIWPLAHLKARVHYFGNAPLCAQVPRAARAAERAGKHRLRPGKLWPQPTTAQHRAPSSLRPAASRVRAGCRVCTATSKYLPRYVVPGNGPRNIGRKLEWRLGGGTHRQRPTL